MIHVEFREDSRKRLSSCVSRGHAGAGEPPHDIVCAAVSAILQAAYAGLQEVANVELAAATRSSGNLAFTIPESDRDRDDVRAIVLTAKIALEQIGRQYPQNLRVATGSET